MIPTSLPTDFLYRGTCRGWPGSEAIQQLGLTCTSSDPLVATVFALECLRHGSGVVYLARFKQVNGLCSDVNALAHLECEITLAVKPVDFERMYVVHEVAAPRAREILEQLGFSLPNSINSYAHLHYMLKETQHAGQRLDAHQIAEFDRRAGA